MRECIYSVPKFLSNTILRSRDLNSINKNIYNSGMLEYENYENGIISGFDIKINNDNIIVHKGIFKYGEVFYLDENLEIEIPKNEGKYILSIDFETINKEYEIEKVMKLIMNDNEKFSGIEIARFDIREGAKLVLGNYELKKFEKEYNTFDFSSAIYSKTSLHPCLLKKWSELMINKKLNDSFDIIFCYLCKLELVNKFILIDYINKKLNKNFKDISNFEILSNLYKVLEEVSENIDEDFSDMKGISFE